MSCFSINTNAIFSRSRHFDPYPLFESDSAQLLRRTSVLQQLSFNGLMEGEHTHLLSERVSSPSPGTPQINPSITSSSPVKPGKTPLPSFKSRGLSVVHTFRSLFNFIYSKSSFPKTPCVELHEYQQVNTCKY